MADPVLRQVLDVEALDTADTGWTVAEYVDGRPYAGILSASNLWLRFQTTTANANRGRANQISRMFLCNNMLERKVVFTPASITDEDALAEATKTDPSCLACHSSLDPLAGYLYGFYIRNPDHPVETLSYYPSRESWWQEVTGVAPAYFGRRAYGGLDELGVRLSKDLRFDACAAETAQTLLLNRSPMEEDFAALQDIKAQYQADGETIRSLMRAVVLDPRYQAATDDDPTAVPVRLMTPDILDLQLRELTGFTWYYLDENMVSLASANGLGLLGGGIDGEYVTRPASLPSVPMLLVHARIAEAAAAYAYDDAGTIAGISIAAEDDEARAQVMTDIRAAIFGPDREGHDVEVDLALFDEVLEATGDEAEAWKAWATFVLSDPDLVIY